MITHRKRIYRFTIDTLADITASIIEHHDALDSALILNFIDHYRAYVEYYTFDENFKKIALVNFELFIGNQLLLNSASSYISLESGEKQVTTPIALKRLTKETELFEH